LFNSKLNGRKLGFNTPLKRSQLSIGVARNFDWEGHKMKKSCNVNLVTFYWRSGSSPPTASLIFDLVKSRDLSSTKSKINDAVGGELPALDNFW